ncbi:Rv1733c family protein [Streptomyces lunalinharesii]|uniref:Membrane protein SCJ1.26 n=1 Tax=Streptomyces lunalinharesii TaxID=333384 RepID=A0ABP6E5V8_9ACTN
MPLAKFRPPWRPGPLRRGTDVAQSWVVLATGVLIAVAAPAAGVVAGSAVDAAAHRESASWRPVSAVVTQEPATRITVDSGTGTGGRVHTTVRWTAPDHTVRTGETTLAAGVHVGDRTTVWLDRNGALVRDPSTPTDSLAESVVAGTVVGSAAGLLFFGAERLTVRLLDRRRYAQWEKEWAEVDARWRHPQQ